jgi:hypothetical protein
MEAIDNMTNYELLKWIIANVKAETIQEEQDICNKAFYAYKNNLDNILNQIAEQIEYNRVTI